MIGEFDLALVCLLACLGVVIIVVVVLPLHSWIEYRRERALRLSRYLKGKRPPTSESELPTRTDYEVCGMLRAGMSQQLVAKRVGMSRHSVALIAEAMRQRGELGKSQ